VSRWGNDAPEFREASSKMLTTFLLSMRGTPYYYFGDELGMTNIKFDKIEDYRDIETLAEYGKVQKAGGNLKQFIEDQKTGGARDNGRTPFQWDAGTNAGFTAGTPWLIVNVNKNEINAEAEEKNENSVLSYFKKMVKLRKEQKEILVYGKYTLLDKDNPDVYTYTRTDGKEVFLVLLNFRKNAAFTPVPKGFSLGEELINNLQPLKLDGNKIVLQPYQCCVVKLK
jgi:oligo-1,6-glucosidase